MNRNPLIVTTGDRKGALSVLGTSVTVLVSNNDSKDLQITFQSGQEGSGPPPHNHEWDEAFYVIGGEVQFTCAGETKTCGAGTLVHVPAGTIHGFSYGAGGGEMLEITGRQSNAVRMFSALDREIDPEHLELSKIAQVAGEYGVAFHL